MFVAFLKQGDVWLDPIEIKAKLKPDAIIKVKTIVLGELVVKADEEGNIIERSFRGGFHGDEEITEIKMYEIKKSLDINLEMWYAELNE